MGKEKVPQWLNSLGGTGFLQSISGVQNQGNVRLYHIGGFNSQQKVSMNGILTDLICTDI